MKPSMYNMNLDKYDDLGPATRRWQPEEGTRASPMHTAV